MRLYWFRVTGSGSFPFHMLSESRCWPMDAIAAHHIELACPTVAPEQKVLLVTFKQPERVEYENWAAAKWPIEGGGAIS